MGNFADVGLIGTLYHINKTYYVNKILAIISQSIYSDRKGFQPLQKRNYAHASVETLRFAPIKVISFTNLGMDSHLEKLFVNNKYKSKGHAIRPEAVERIIKEILDSEIDENYFKDIRTVLSWSGTALPSNYTRPLASKTRELLNLNYHKYSEKK